MTLAVYKVGIVVDRKCGDLIANLARCFHVWVVESPDNTPAIQQVWKNEQDGSAAKVPYAGITSFTARDEESLEAICARIVGDVEDHHGEFAHDPPWSEIEVFGVKLSPALKQVLLEIGADAFESTRDGFICRKSADAQ